MREMAHAMIDVSVIIPVYNTEKNIEQCVRSVMNQTLESIEIICVDDGSTDGSRAILERLAKEDARIAVIAQENAGAGAARNRGLQLARGRYLSFLDADDFFEPDMLEAALAAADSCGAEVAVFGKNLGALVAAGVPHERQADAIGQKRRGGGADVRQIGCGRDEIPVGAPVLDGQGPKDVGKLRDGDVASLAAPAPRRVLAVDASHRASREEDGP